jgi:Transmembrane domain of unknown function (DUF3566)
MEVKVMEDVKEAYAEMGDVKEVESLPVVSFALIISVIALILTFLAGIIWFIVGYAALYNLTTVIIHLNTNSTAVVNSVAGSITAMGALYLIIVWPIMAFIGTFIGAAIAAILYNVLAPRVGGIKLQLK